MLAKQLRNWRVRQVLPRAAADLALVHGSFAVSLAATLAYWVARGEGQEVSRLVAQALGYYFSTFLPLSLVFPLAFVAGGLYRPAGEDESRGTLILRVAGLSVLLFFGVNALLLPSDSAVRVPLALFCPIAMLVLCGVRWVKNEVLQRFDIRPRRVSVTAANQGAVLVVGGAGYIGSSLVRKLLDEGRRVRVLDSLVYGDAALKDILGHPRLELRAGDCRNIQSVVSAVKDMESVVHLAAIVGDPACDLDHQTTLETNYAATRMLIEVAKGHSVNRLVFASSCSVYGATDEIMDEHSPVQPISLYGQTKVDSERALMAARSSDFHPVILRLATVFGLSWRPRFDLVVNLLTAKAFTEGVITVFNGNQWRPFIHVHDVAGGMIRALDAPLALVSGEVFNLGDDRLNLTLAQVAEKIRTMFPGTKVEQVENLDRRNYRVSFKKIRNQLGFECAYGLEHGMNEIRHAFESKRIVDYTNMQYHNQKFLKLSGSPSCKDEFDARVMAAFAHLPVQVQGRG